MPATPQDLPARFVRPHRRTARLQVDGPRVALRARLRGAHEAGAAGGAGRLGRQALKGGARPGAEATTITGGVVVVKNLLK